TGRSLDWFFQQWVYGPGHPDLQLVYGWEAERSLVSLTVRQTQPVSAGAPLFKLPVQVSLVGTAGEHSLPLSIESAEQTFVVHQAAEPQRLRFDAGFHALKTLELDLPTRMLSSQLEADPDVLLRIDAARALGKRGDRESTAALASALASDGFWGFHVQVAKALADVRSSAARSALLAALATPHPRARRGVVEALGSFREEAVAEALTEITARGDASYFVEAEAFRSLGKTRSKHAYETLLGGLDRDSYDEVIRIGVFDGLKELRDDRAIDTALEWTAYGRPTRAREAAVRSLEKLGERDSRVDDELVRLLDDRRIASRGTRAAAIATLRQRKRTEAIPALERVVERDPDGRLVRQAREALRALREGRDKQDEMAQLKERLDTLADENRKLRDRLDRLEGAAGSQPES
ncbi:MAG: HEAT repeat domain-containing protein, partial [Chloroflexota bacterium]